MVTCVFATKSLHAGSVREEKELCTASERDQAGKPLSIVNIEHLVFQPLFRMFFRKHGGQNKS